MWINRTVLTFFVSDNIIFKDKYLVAIVVFRYFAAVSYETEQRQ